MRHKATLPPIFPVFGPLEATYLGEWGQKLKFRCAVICKYFFSFLTDTWYKLSLGCNTSDFLIIFFKKLIKNSCNANKNLKKLHLEAKFSNFRMALVPFKNLQRFLQKKCGKHLKIGKKDLSRVAKFVSHNGTCYGNK